MMTSAWLTTKRMGIAMLSMAVGCAVTAAPAWTATLQPDSDSSIRADDAATLTEKKGQVLKRAFANEQRTALAAPQPALLGDSLLEGMQLATMQKSYAQLSWKDVVSRLWANSVVAIAPNRRLVNLQKGQLLFCLDKQRKDKREYVLWSNLLQARVRGTTVLFQTEADRCQITVLEGCIDVLNKKDRSVVRLHPGSVLTVIGKQVKPDAAQADSNGGDSGDAPLDSLGNGAMVPLFETEHEITYVSLVAPATYAAPIVRAFTSSLPSEPLLDRTLSALPAALTQLDPQASQLTAGALRLLSNSVEILRLPTGIDYQIGPQIGSTFKLPANAVSFFPPSGVIGQQASLPLASPLSGSALVPMAEGLGPSVVNANSVQSSALNTMPAGQLVGGLMTGTSVLSGAGMVTNSALTSTRATLSAVTSSSVSTLGGVATGTGSAGSSLLNGVGGVVNQVLRAP